MCRRPERLDMPISASEKWKLKVTETYQILSFCPFSGDLVLYVCTDISASWGPGMGAEGAVLLPPAPNGTAGISRGARQCWVRGEIRADGWQGWPGGWDNAGTYAASMRWEEMFPATATALSLAAVWEGLRAWPFVSSVFYKNISTLFKWKSYLGKSWKVTPCLQRPSWPTHVHLCHTPLIPCLPACTSIRSPVSVW